MADNVFDASTVLFDPMGQTVNQLKWSMEANFTDEARPIDQISAAFDQRGFPLIFYRTTDGELILYWNSPGTNFEKKSLGPGSYPNIVFNDPLNVNAPHADVILAYVRKNRVFYRRFTEMFGPEYALFPYRPEITARLSATTGIADSTGQIWNINGDVAASNSGFLGSAIRFFGGFMRTNIAGRDYAFGTEDFTIGFRIFPQWPMLMQETSQFICGNWSATAGGFGWGVFVRANGRLEVRLNKLVYVEKTGSVIDGLWSNIIVTRKGTDLFLFVNGVNVAVFDDPATNITFIQPIYIAKSPAFATATNFMLEDFYVIKGYAKYTKDFVVPRVVTELWFNATTQMSDGLVFAADFTSKEINPWVSRSSWDILPNTPVTYLPEANEYFLDLTYEGDIRGLKSSSLNEHFIFNRNDFSVRFRALHRNTLIQYDEETVFNFHGGLNDPIGFLIGFRLGKRPFIRIDIGQVSHEVISPIAAEYDRVNDILFCRSAGVMYIFINGKLAISSPWDHAITVAQPATIGYRHAQTTADTTNNPVANRNPYRGFLGSVEVYRGRALATENYTLKDLPIVRYPLFKKGSTLAPVTAISSMGMRTDRRFQISSHTVTPKELLKKNIYVTRNREYFVLSNPVLKIAHGSGTSAVRLRLVDFEHTDTTLSPIVLIGAAEDASQVPAVKVKVANVLNEQGVPVSDYMVDLPAEFSVSVFPKFTPTSNNVLGNRSLTIDPYRTLCVVVNGVVKTITLSTPFGKGYWEFLFSSSKFTIKHNGTTVYTGSGVPTPAAYSKYAIAYTIRSNEKKPRPLNRVAISQVEFESDYSSIVDGVSRGIQQFTLDAPDKLSFKSQTLHSELLIANGNLKRWI